MTWRNSRPFAPCTVLSVSGPETSRKVPSPTPSSTIGGSRRAIGARASASITDAKARRPKGFDLGSFVRDGWAHYGTGKAIRLEVLFSAAAAEHLAETPLSEDQRIGPEIDGRIRLRATVPDTPQLRWWFLAFGDAVQVMAPAALRQWFATTASAMAGMYEEERTRAGVLMA